MNKIFILMWIPGLFWLFPIWGWYNLNRIYDYLTIHAIYTGMQIGFLIHFLELIR